MRAGRVATRIEDSRAVFCASSISVVRSVQRWYAGEGQRGVPPIIHQFAISSIAWIKKPSAARGVKIHELAAICAAALRPARSTWNKFMENLQKLRVDHVLSDDETIAIVASEMTEPLLQDLESTDGATA